MSINDLLDSETLIPSMLIIFAVIILIAIPVGIANGKKTNDNIYGDNEYGAIKEEKNARIIARRTSPHPLNQAVLINLVVFELANGSRIELAIKNPNTYSVMVEGDCGTLRYSGKKFISFHRSIGNGI